MHFYKQLFYFFYGFGKNYKQASHDPCDLFFKTRVELIKQVFINKGVSLHHKDPKTDSQHVQFKSITLVGINAKCKLQILGMDRWYFKVIEKTELPF